MHRGLLVLAGLIMIVGLGFTAEIFDWSANDFGPKSFAQTIYLAVGLLTVAAITGLTGAYVNERVQPDPEPKRVYCSYCDTENSLHSNECKECHLSGYLEFIY